MMIPPSNNHGDPLVIQFADVYATITCDDPTVRQDVRGLFRHCQLAPPPASIVPSVALTVRRDDDATFTLIGAGTTPYRLVSQSNLVERVLYEVTVGLATASQSAMVVHSAGLVGRGLGMLLVGPSGSGKSTLTTRCLLSGYDFLSDEAVAVDPKRHEVRGFARPIALKDPGTALGNSRIVGDSELAQQASSGVCYLDPERLRRGNVRPCSALDVLVLPTYAAAAPDVFRHLTPAETVFRLMPRIVNAQRLPRRSFDDVVAVGRARPAYAIGYSSAERALQWLERITAECYNYDDRRPPPT